MSSRIESFVSTSFRSRSIGRCPWEHSAVKEMAAFVGQRSAGFCDWSTEVDVCARDEQE